MIWKSFLPHKVTSLECYYLYYPRAQLCNGSYANEIGTFRTEAEILGKI